LFNFIDLLKSKKKTTRLKNLYTQALNSVKVGTLFAQSWSQEIVKFMKDVNKTILLGRLGAHPVQRLTKAGIPVTHFSVATTRRWNKNTTHLATAESVSTADSSSLAEETQWHQVVAWGKQALQCAQSLKKGSSVYVEGSIRSHPYTDKNGHQKFSFEIHVENVSFLNKRETPSESDEQDNVHHNVQETRLEGTDPEPARPLLTELEAATHLQS
jgi:single-strand DNA-binding protein